MITESMVSAISRIISDDYPSTDFILSEALFRSQTPDEWESNQDLEMAELSVNQFKVPSKSDPAINKEGTILLPTFVSDYNPKFIVSGIWNILQKRQSVIISGKPGFAYQGESAPYVGAVGNNSIDRAVEQYMQKGAIVAVKVDDYALSDLSNMDLPGPSGKETIDNEWMVEIKETMDDLERQGLVEIEKYPSIPRKFGNYWAIVPEMRDNAIMLFSRKYGEGFYIVGRKIDGMDWDVAIQHFYSDPFSYLKRVNIDPEQMGASRRSRTRLLFRDYLNATKQGVYVDRAKGNGADDIYSFATGEHIQGVPEGVFEHILRPNYFI